jgi:D-alanine-D-alanine ligase
MNESEKLNIAVFMGGQSGEHDVSINSGKAVIKNIDRGKYIPFPVIIGLDGGFFFPKADDPDTWGLRYDAGEAINRLRDMKIHCAFIAMHGPYGEDGKIQSLFELIHIPYTGSDVYGSAAAMDKKISKKIYLSSGIQTPDYLEIEERDFRKDQTGFMRSVISKTGLPVVLKTPRLGSSIGVEIIKNEKELVSALNRLFAIDQCVLAEKYIKGRELTCPVLEDPETRIPFALPLIEIIPKKHEFFNYEEKYDPETSEICPAPIDEKTAERIRILGIMAHKALGLRGFSRTDFMVSEKNEVYTLETNSIPGLTEVSLFPKAAKVHGISYPRLIDILIQRAVNK